MKALFTFFILFIFFQLAAQEWQAKASYPALGRDDGIAFSIKNFGYCVTGKTAGYAESNSLFQYNANTDSWTEKASFEGIERQYTTAFTIGAKAYIIGGYSKQGNGLAEVWCYDAVLGEWIEKKPFPGGARWGSFAFAVGGKGYLGCGTNIDTVLSDFWEYSPSNDTWSQLDDFIGGARREGVATASAGFGFAGLGLKDFSATGFYKDCYVFDPLNKKWTQAADYPGGFNAYGKAEKLGNTVVVGTGMDENQIFTNACWKFDVSNWTWSKLPKLPGEAIRGAASFSIYNRVYFVTGLTESFNRTNALKALEFPIESLAILLYPNPSEGRFHIEGNLGNTEMTLSVFNALGELLVKETIQSDFFDYSFLSTGLYFLQITTENGQEVKKQLVIL